VFNFDTLQKNVSRVEFVLTHIGAPCFKSWHKMNLLLQFFLKRRRKEKEVKCFVEVGWWVTRLVARHVLKLGKKEVSERSNCNYRKKEVVVGLGLTTLWRHVVNESGLTQVLIVGCHVVKG
jgi:hypothetical protein